MSKSRKILNMRSSVRTLSIKCYDEQMPEGWDAVRNNINVIDKSVWQVIGICHDRDYVGDAFWAPTIEKNHYHIIVRILNGKNARVEQILRTIGIVYRPVEDKTLWENHGVETCADYTAMSVYLTHDTEQAIADGKEHYDLEELASNLSIEEIKQVREGYTRVSESAEKVTPRVLAELDAEAYELGKNIGNFEKWYRAQPFNIRSQSKMKTIKESYEAGLDEGIKSMDEIPRLSVFVQSPPNMGKTYAVKHACKRMGMDYLAIEAGGTGKFDNLTVSTDAVIVDDESLPHPLAMADTKCCRVYRRNKNNPAWVGRFLCVTSNLSFEEWLEKKCGIKDEDEKKAARSRFYICHLEQVEGVYEIVCTDRAKRGAPQLKRDIREMYEQFRDIFNEYVAEHQGFDDEEDSYDVNTEAYKKKRYKEMPPEEANRQELLEVEKEYEVTTEREQTAYNSYNNDSGAWYLLYDKRLDLRRRVAVIRWRIANHYPPDRYATPEEENEVKKYLPPM